LIAIFDDNTNVCANILRVQSTDSTTEIDSPEKIITRSMLQTPSIQFRYLIASDAGIETPAINITFQFAIGILQPKPMKQNYVYQSSW